MSCSPTWPECRFERCEAGGPHGDVVDGHPGGQSYHLPGCPFGFATGAALRGSVDFANVDRPAAAVAGDVDIEAGHWFPPGLTEALPPGTSLSVDDEMPSLLTSTRSATRRFKWTVPARRDVPGSRPRQSSLNGDDHPATARCVRRRPDRGARRGSVVHRSYVRRLSTFLPRLASVFDGLQ